MEKWNWNEWTGMVPAGSSVDVSFQPSFPWHTSGLNFKGTAHAELLVAAMFVGALEQMSQPIPTLVFDSLPPMDLDVCPTAVAVTIRLENRGTFDRAAKLELLGRELERVP